MKSLFSLGAQSQLENEMSNTVSFNPQRLLVIEMKDSQSEIVNKKKEEELASINKSKVEKTLSNCVMKKIKLSEFYLF